DRPAREGGRHAPHVRPGPARPRRVLRGTVPAAALVRLPGPPTATSSSGTGRRTSPAPTARPCPASPPHPSTSGAPATSAAWRSTGSSRPSPWTQVPYPKTLPVEGITPEGIAATVTTRCYTTVQVLGRTRHRRARLRRGDPPRGTARRPPRRPGQGDRVRRPREDARG